MDDNSKLLSDLISIASETFRFYRVFTKAIGKLDYDEQTKYLSQFSWFYKRVMKALENAGLRIMNLEGHPYDPGMAITPLNLDEFEPDDSLYVEQMVEPIIMRDDKVMKLGTVILGRAEK